MSVESIRQQLELEKAAFRYTYGPPEVDGYMTDKLAAFIAGQGTEDIRDIQYYDGAQTVQGLLYVDDDGTYVMGPKLERVQYLYDALSGRRYPSMQGQHGWGTPGKWNGVYDPRTIYVDGPGKWRVWMVARYTTDRVPYFVPVVEQMGTAGVFSGLIEEISPILPIVSIALAFLAPGLGAAIGNAILPAGTSASIAAAVGNLALSTAFNGGNIEAALIGALTGQIGGFAGGAIASATESAVIGKLAATATSAALRGGDIKQAVASTLLVEGAKNVATLADSWGADDAGAIQSWEAYDWSVPVDASVDFTDEVLSAADYFDPVYDAPADPVAAVDYFDPVYDESGAAVVTSGGYGESVFNPTGMDRTTLPTTSGPAPVSSSGGSDIIVTLTNAALAAIKVNQAYQATKAPQPRTSTVSGNTVKTGNPNGTVTVRNTQTGATAVTRPEVGVPYTLANGSTIINNGNGTFTTIRADGSSATANYASSSSSSAGGFSITPTMMLAAGGVGLLLLMQRGTR